MTQLALEEGARAQRDPNYRWLVSDIAANEQLRKQTSVSLNLKVRKEERARLDAERLARENARRASLGQPALKTAEDLETEDAPDVVLDQAAEVMADMVTGVRKIPGKAAPIAVQADNRPVPVRP